MQHDYTVFPDVLLKADSPNYPSRFAPSRARIITEQICTDARLARLSPAAECLFYRLLVNTDWKGRILADPQYIASQCFPKRAGYDTADLMHIWLSSLEAVGLIMRCLHKGKDHYILNAPELYRLNGRVNKGRLSPSVWQRIRQRIFKRDQATCQYCGAQGKQLHCDHIVPLSMGGSNEEDNLVTACSDCNVRKGRRTPQQWLNNQSGER